MRDKAASIVVRRMDAGDLARVMEIAATLKNAPHYARTTWLEMLAPQNRPERIALVAVGGDGALHGFAVAIVLPPQAELESVAVADASQRRGIGRLLLRSLLDELRGAGVLDLWLEVRVSNAPAVALYQSLGFAESGRRIRYYIDPVEDALLMNLQLG